MRRDYMLSRDIDWFARCDSYFLHFASNGSILPINFKHSDLRRIQQAVADAELLTDIDDVRINQVWIDRMQANGQMEGTTIEDYTRSFKIFAAKGFYSFDWNPRTEAYELVVSPAEGCPPPRFDERIFPPIILEEVNENEEYFTYIPNKK